LHNCTTAREPGQELEGGDEDEDDDIDADTEVGVREAIEGNSYLIRRGGRRDREEGEGEGEEGDCK